MNIPSKVKVGGRTYRVEILDRPLLSEGYTGTPLCGRINYDECVIQLSTFGFSADSIVLTFLHELVHAIAHERMIDWGERDEEYTESLAKGLHALIVDNDVTMNGASTP